MSRPARQPIRRPGTNRRTSRACDGVPTAAPADRPRPHARYARFATDEDHLPPEARLPPFENPDIVDRAAKVVDPQPDYTDLCHQEFIGMIRYRQDALDFRMHLYPSKKDRRALERVAKSLEKAMDAIESLSPAFQTKLFVVQQSPSEANKQVARFRDWAGWLASRATLFARDPAVRMPGNKTFNKGNPTKKLAAYFAYQILEQFGDRPPTLTRGGRARAAEPGPFFKLAQIFYEAMTGKPNASLDRQCIDVHRQQRRYQRGASGR